VLLDVRTQGEWTLCRIEGARLVPLPELERRLDELDPAAEIVVYCHDEECNASPIAAKKLESLGYRNVTEFPGGKKAWREAGYPVEE